MGPPDDAGFEVRCERRGEGAVLVVAQGELDVATAPVLQRVLSEPDAAAPLVVLDLRSVTFIDSNGLSVVAARHQLAKRQGGRFAVATEGADQVRRVFSLSGLSDTIDLIGRPSEALPQ